MLCISPSGDSNISTYIYTPEGQKIESGESLKILGVYFGQRPTAEAHLAAITQKFYARLWLIHHLKNSGVPNLDVLAIYQSMARPVLEFASPAFHPLLTAAQSGHLERLQARAYKIIIGWNVSYNTAINMTSTPRAAERREKLCQNFAKKPSKNVQF